MSFDQTLSRERLLLAAGFYASALIAAAVAWLHSAARGGALFLCGPSAEAHCWACYASPMLALTGSAVLLSAGHAARRSRA